MNEVISELRETLRRRRPHLLFSSKQQSDVVRDVSAVDGNSSNTKQISKSVHDELQLEAARELVNAIAVAVWNLDLSCESMTNEQIMENDDEKKTSIDVTYDRRGESNKLPKTEWNEDVKSLIRESYGVLYAISKPEDISGSALIQQKQQLLDELRCIVRTSILELLPSLNTRECRHFLLDFLSLFLPLSLMTPNGTAASVDSNAWAPPPWLRRHNDAEFVSLFDSVRVDDQCKLESTKLLETTVEEFLQIFNTLIQTDPSTLAPFLGTMSLLFGKLPAINDQLPAANARNDLCSIETIAIKNRKKCCRLCISFLPTIPEHDLPSIIPSLFTLVCDKEDSSIVVQAIRKEWVSISTSKSDDDSALFIGNVIISLILSNEMAGTKHISESFLDEITQSLRDYFEGCIKDDNETRTKKKHDHDVLSTLDTMVIVALYSQQQHRLTIEELIDSLVSRQSCIALSFVQPLIRIWELKKDASKSLRGNKADSNLDLPMYKELATSVISLLFYLMIAASTSRKCPDYLDSVRIGGMISFCKIDMTETDKDHSYQELRHNCCKAFRVLYFVLDPKRREQIINSLLSMLSDSFVQSCLPSNTGKTNQSSSTPAPNLIAASYSACCILLLLIEDHPADIMQTKGTLLERLLLLSSHNEGDITYKLFDMTCALLVALLRESNTPGGNINGGVSDLLILCQKLLFTANFTPKEFDTIHENRHRVICGIILAARLLRCSNISRSERIDIWNTVAKLTASQNLNPEVGIWGIPFLRFASSTLSFHDIPHSVDISSVCGQREMFQIINLMLSATGVIQMENSLKFSKQTQESDAFLAFNDIVMEHNSLPRTKDTQAPRFVISAPYFLSRLHRNDSRAEIDINLVSSYVYNLVDCYLQLGMCSQQGWNPRGWLLAKVQLPCSLPEAMINLIGFQQNSATKIELDNPQDGSLNPNAWQSNNTQIKNVVADILKQKTRATIIQNSINFMNSVVISISVSCIVLKHANEHYQHQSSHQESGSNQKLKRRMMALQTLIRFQLAKIYRMQHINKKMHLVLKSLYAELYQLGQMQSKASEIAQKTATVHPWNTPNLRMSLSGLRYNIESISTFLSNVDLINCTTLWNCLHKQDCNDDHLCDLDLESVGSCKVPFHLRLRVDILQQLRLSFKNQFNSFSSVGERNATFLQYSLRHVPRVYTTTLALSSRLSNIDKFTSSIDRKHILVFISCHYNLLSMAFLLHTKDLKIQLHVDERIDVIHRKKVRLKPDSTENITSISDLLVACASNGTKDESISKSSLDATVETLVGQLVEQIELCEDSSITCQIIDLISMITIHIDIDKACAVVKNVTKKVLGVFYNSTVAEVDLPYMLCKIGNCVRSDNESQASFSRLFQLAKKMMKIRDLSVFVHILLSHWSALILGGSSQDHFLADICEAVDDVLSFASNMNSKQTDKRTSKRNQFPSLSAKMSTHVFELLMQMTASSLSLVHLVQKYEKKSNRNENERTSYDDTIRLLAVFHKMICVFQSHSVFFSRHTFFGVTKTSLLVASVSIYQLQNCVRWRSSQHFSLHNLANDDQSSVNSLQPLVEAICSYCIESIVTFCDSFKRSDSENEHCHKYAKAIATLSYKCEGLKKVVQTICSTQGLLIQNNVIRNESNSGTNLSKRCNESTHQVKKRQRNCSDIGTSSSSYPGRVYTSPGSLSESSSTENNDSDTASKEDGSFGVLGDWG